MMKIWRTLGTAIDGFRRDDTGVVTVEFVLIFPVFFTIFLMTYESGMISLRHFSLERGIDLAVRDVRIGVLESPTRESLRDSICASARLIPDCRNQLQVEMLRRNLRNWVAVPTTVRCIDRGEVVQPLVEFQTGGNNELVFLRACVRLDPVLPLSGIGRAIVRENDNTAAAGSYALVSSSAFVVEPFQVSGN